MRLYKIPKINWQCQLASTYDGHARRTHRSTNTFVEYAIQCEKDKFYCYYGGRFKEFNSLADAKNWVEQTHYPAQVEKYLEVA